MTKQRMAMRSNFPWSDFRKLGTPELGSSSSTSTALSPKNFEKRAHPNYYHGRLIYDRKILVSKNLVNNTFIVKKTCFLETSNKNILNVKRTK